MQVRVFNADRTIKRLSKIGNVDLSDVLKKGAQTVYNDAKRLAPVNKDSRASTRGDLLRSIRYWAIGGRYKNGAYVGTNVNYAIYQEFGTYKMKAQPFMRPAFDKNAPLIRQAIVKAIKENNAKR
jgi:HK97 gp10 family phage protein